VSFWIKLLKKEIPPELFGENVLKLILSEIIERIKTYMTGMF
jgi:hypothetical protein